MKSYYTSLRAIFSPSQKNLLTMKTVLPLHIHMLLADSPPVYYGYVPSETSPNNYWLFGVVFVLPFQAFNFEILAKNNYSDLFCLNTNEEDHILCYSWRFWSLPRIYDRKSRFSTVVTELFPIDPTDRLISTRHSNLPQRHGLFQSVTIFLRGTFRPLLLCIRLFRFDLFWQESSLTIYHISPGSAVCSYICIVLETVRKRIWTI